MVRIRLSRVGRHARPFYRIVVADGTASRDGKHIEILGTYDPFTKKTAFNEASALKWLKEGASTSATVKMLFDKSALQKKESETTTNQ
jgi:small subunit ribosomal protein S16